MTTEQSQLAVARGKVAAARVEIAAVAAERRKLTDEANALVPRLKTGTDRKAERRVLDLNAQIDELQAQENQLNIVLDRARADLVLAEQNSRHARMVLRQAEAAAALWADIYADLQPTHDRLNAIRAHAARNVGGFNVLGQHVGGAISQADVDAIGRTVTLLGSGIAALAHLDEARAYARQRGLPDDGDELEAAA